MEPKVPHFGVLGMKFEKASVIFEINTLDFAEMQRFMQK